MYVYTGTHIDRYSHIRCTVTIIYTYTYTCTRIIYIYIYILLLSFFILTPFKYNIY